MNQEFQGHKKLTRAQGFCPMDFSKISEYPLDN